MLIFKFGKQTLLKKELLYNPASVVRVSSFNSPPLSLSLYIYIYRPGKTRNKSDIENVQIWKKITRSQKMILFIIWIICQG